MNWVALISILSTIPPKTGQFITINPTHESFSAMTHRVTDSSERAFLITSTQAVRLPVHLKSCRHSKEIHFPPQQRWQFAFPLPNLNLTGWHIHAVATPAADLHRAWFVALIALLDLRSAQDKRRKKRQENSIIFQIICSSFREYLKQKRISQPPSSWTSLLYLCKDVSLPACLQVLLHAGAMEMWSAAPPGQVCLGGAQRLPGPNGIIQHCLKVKAQSRTTSQISSVHHRNIVRIIVTANSGKSTKTGISLHNIQLFL